MKCCRVFVNVLVGFHCTFLFLSTIFFFLYGVFVVVVFYAEDGRLSVMFIADLPAITE